MSKERHPGLEHDGFEVGRCAFTAEQVAGILSELLPALEQAEAGQGPIRGVGEAPGARLPITVDRPTLIDTGRLPSETRRKSVVASRNVLRLWPGALALARAVPIARVVTEVLGAGCGLVRALYFDKPPGRSWSLPWHKDLTIAVREHRPELLQSCKPTFKAGVPHVEASESVLVAMLSARVHLDDVDDDNGPLLVVSGSHRDGKGLTAVTPDRPIQTIHVRAGDVLFMRPLLTHCSRQSDPRTERHRRIIHFEFAASPVLPDGHEWHDFHDVRW